MNADLIALIIGGIVMAAVICVELVRGTLPGFAREHRSCPWRWCSFELAVTAISGKAGIDQAAMSGKLTRGVSLNVAMVSRLK